MESGYTRRKQPEIVRRALLDQAAKLAVEQGLAAVTVQAVSDAAGETKGGFMHHFPHKQALIDAVFQELMDMIDGKMTYRRVYRQTQPLKAVGQRLDKDIVFQAVRSK